MVSRIAAVAEAVNIPIVADGDTGYGNAINVMRTVRVYEQVGCSAIQLEDQHFPKRCGHLAGKELVSADEMAGKVRAACDARRSDDFVVIARTDALATHGMSEALARAEIYLAAGADVIFVESPANREDLEIVAARLGGKVPLLANMVEGGKTPLFTNQELQEMGYGIVIYPNAILRGVAQVGQLILDDLKSKDTTRESLHLMRNFKELNKLLGIDGFRELEEKYLSKR
jgi:2-methylisocitrate lyase-like PEP mutase family enzyme